MSTCKAYIRGQQYFCDHCGTTWDMDDSAPECKPVTAPFNKKVISLVVHRNIGNRALLKIRENLNNEN